MSYLKDFEGNVHPLQPYILRSGNLTFSSLIYPLKIVISHSYVNLPEGTNAIHTSTLP